MDDADRKTFYKALIDYGIDYTAKPPHVVEEWFRVYLAARRAREKALRMHQLRQYSTFK